MRLAFSTLLALLGACAASPRAPTPAPIAAIQPPAPESPTGLRAAVGVDGGCAIRARELWCWGAPLGGGPPRRVPEVELSTDDARVEVAEGTACVIDGGSLRCFGALTEEARYDRIAQLEDAGAVDEAAALETGPFVMRFAELASDVSIAIGGLCWIAEGRAQCFAVGSDSPTFGTVPPITDGRRIAISDEHGCIVRRGGELVCWGEGSSFGVFTGDGMSTGRTLAADATEVVAGLGFVCALREGGSVRCWGDSLVDVEAYSDEDLEAAEEAGGLPPYDWPAVTAVELGAGDLHACARTAHGAVWCLGDGQLGQGGAGTTTRADRPIRAAVLGNGEALAVGGQGTCVVRGETLRCVGDGSEGAFDGQRRAEEWVTVFTDAEAMVVPRTPPLVCRVGADDQVRCTGGRPGTGILEGIHPRVIEGVPRATRAVATLDGHRCALAEGRVTCVGRREPPAAMDAVAQLVGGLRAMCVRRDDGVRCLGTRFGPSPLATPGAWQEIPALAGAVDLAMDDLGGVVCAALGSGRLVCHGAEPPLGAIAGMDDIVGVRMGSSGRLLCVLRRGGAATCTGRADALDDVVDIAFQSVTPIVLHEDGTLEWVGRRHDPAEFGSPARALAARAGLLCVHTEDRAVRCLGKGTQGELGRIPAGVALEPVEVRPFGP
ncbi:MAG: hypothetical protein CMN30_16250 [Sandaracinus sp.]|nr:hypothetical protein [Sandaracinus sp.]|tara:strand:+ start:6091 stop:8076 length:1986 start_codon:yes stop_codon:yes gene_type:complete